MDSNKNSILRDRSGAALVIALVMIIVLTVIGLAANFTSIFEIKLSGNKRGSTDAFYTADAGVQAALADLTNLNTSVGYVDVAPGTLPADLDKELIDKKLTSPSWSSLPAGQDFVERPLVTVYHTSKTGAPRGVGFSAAGTVEYQYHIVDSVGKDQMDRSLIRSSCQVREKIVRLVPVQ
jgi:Tfp pilus assembly protein PilX